MRTLAVVMANAGLAVVLVSGCAKTPATASLPSTQPPDGRVTATPIERRVDTVAARPFQPVASTGSQGATGQALTPGRFETSGFAVDANVKVVYFDFDRYDLRAADARTLDGNAEYLKAHPSLLVIVEGHADERGTNEYNVALGERRARAARDYLVSRGVEAGRITVLSYGEDRPACTQHTEACWAQNRRAEFRGKAQ